MQEIKDWLNSNEGLLSLLLFIVSLIIGWISGIFRVLMQKPKFKVRIIPKMTFGTVYLTGEKYTPPMQGTYDLHKTAFAIYLEITNVGSASSDIGKIEIGYFRNNGKSTLFQKRIWIKETNILGDFSIPTLDGKQVLLRHLHQGNFNLDQKNDTYLPVGKSIVGVSYFEQPTSWGNHFPRLDDNELTDIKVVVKDAFENKYVAKAKVPMKDIKDCWRYNPSFGLTDQFYDKDQVKDLDEENSNSENKGGEK